MMMYLMSLKIGLQMLLRGIYARLRYIGLCQYAEFLVAHNRPNDASRVRRQARRMRKVL